MVHFSTAVSGNLERLTASELDSDRELVAWVNLQHIMDAAYSEIGSDRGRISVNNLASIQTDLKSFERQLASWKEKHWHHIQRESSQSSCSSAQI